MLEKLYGGIGFYQSEDIYNTINKPADRNLKFDEITKRISDLETHRRKHLRICATPNNDSSSRSFLQITVNLKRQFDGKDIINKMIFFDMPGTENTVRIRSEFLGVETFNLIKLLQSSNKQYGFLTEDKVEKYLKKAFTIFGTAQGEFDKFTLKNIENLTNAKQQYDLLTEYTRSSITNFFKNKICTFNNFNRALNLQNGSLKYISDISQAIILFLNGFSEKNIFELTVLNKSFKIFNKDIIKIICKYFIKSVILRPADNLVKKQQNDKVYRYFTLRPTIKANINTLININDEDEVKNIETVFDINFNSNNIDKFNFKNNNVFLDQIPIYDFTLLIDKNDDDGNVITPGRLPISSDAKYEYIKNDTDNPLIRYFITLMNIIISKTLTTIDKLDESSTYGSILILIYKYIDFIVKQGSAIVTNLEHLKFFFLSNTNNVEKYNNNKSVDTEKYKCENNNKCNNLITNERNYSRSTKVGTTGTEINESINMGEMNKYRLLAILQSLANQNSDLDQLATKLYKNKANANEYTLDLFKSKPILGAPAAAAPAAAAAAAAKQKKSLFVMFTNIKIFRDDSTKSTDKSDIETDPANKYLKTNLELLCAAEYDTLEFAQSISSTTQGAATAVASGGSKTKSNNIKYFSMNELNKKNNKIKTRRNFSITNKKHNKNKDKMFSTRSKKNIH